MAPQKRLSWEEWKQRANSNYVKGRFGVQEMISSWGYPEGMSAETHKIEFDKGKAKRKDRAGRRAQRTKYNAKRQTAATSQTVGKDVYGKGVITPKGSGLEEHHKRIVTVYAPFFEGLNPKETKELAQWFVDEGFPLGNVEENLEAAKKVEHSAIHEWTKNNFIEPKTGKPLLNFKNYTLNERLVPALTFLEQVQPAVDEKLAEIKGTTVKLKSNLMPNRAAVVARNPLVKGAKALSKAIPGPLDAAIPAVVGGGVALASGATLPQAAQAAGAGAVEGLTGDLQGGDLANLQSYIVDGKQRFINQRNELVDQPGYGLQQRGGKWEVVKRGTGAATQQQRQATRAAVQQATKLIPQVNRVINPVGAAMGDLFKPIGSAFNSVFGKREI